MIETANRDFGFFGTAAGTYGQALAQMTYDAAARLLMQDYNFNQIGAVTVLDSSCGRHWADALNHPSVDEIERTAPSLASWFRTFTKRPRKAA